MTPAQKEMQNVCALAIHKHYAHIKSRDFLELAKALKLTKSRLQNAMSQIVPVGNRDNHAYGAMAMHNANFIACGVITGIFHTVDSIFESLDLSRPLDFFSYVALKDFVNFSYKAKDTVNNYYSEMHFDHGFTFKCKWDCLDKVKANIKEFQTDYECKESVYAGLVLRYPFWQKMMREEFARIFVFDIKNNGNDYDFGMYEPDWKYLEPGEESKEFGTEPKARTPYGNM
jgi:hypothetical protein